jgi:hypothetical protein
LIVPQIELHKTPAGMDEKLTLEWEIDVRKKVAGFWERLSQEYAWNVSEEHNNRTRLLDRSRRVLSRVPV